MPPDTTAGYVTLVVQLGSFGILAWLIYKWPMQIVNALEAIRMMLAHLSETVSKLARAITLLTIQIRNPKADVSDEACELHRELLEHDEARKALERDKPRDERPNSRG